MNILIDNLNFNYLLGFADIDLIRFFIKNKSLWLLDFSYNPFAIRNFCKRETTVFCRGSRHKCSILCKFCFFGFEDTDNSTLKCFSIPVNLLT